MPNLRRRLAPAALLALVVGLTGCADDGEPQAEPTDRPSSQSTTRSSEPSTTEQTAGATLSVTVSGDEISPTAETIEMSAGDVLTVRVTADRPGELHIHSSPEQYVEFGSGETRQEIMLDKPGQVDVEEHDSGTLVARVLVQ